MKLLEAFNPAEVRACGKMVRRLLGAGLKAEDILEYSRFFEVNAARLVMTKLKLVFAVPKDEVLDKEVFLSACGYEVLRGWLKLTKLIEKHGISKEEIRQFAVRDRKRVLGLTEFGLVSG